MRNARRLVRAPHAGLPHRRTSAHRRTARHPTAVKSRQVDLR
ncbi:hypothetical protein SBD_7461 [Streptomyces bottropensis ATCC 25435]|uniref:Uncharacterized protein n=1 Tax=Streptomyces bottropensis ATCC 25435 TaxID=1054862 RepID=M3FFJ5_9ACTN|nr:hypothetical protein SBD_7461 [Streptomyces bottropensis ATCC 25435]